MLGNFNPQLLPEEFADLFEEPETNKTKPMDKENVTFISKNKIGTDYNYKHEVVWKNAIGFLIMHMLASYGLFLLFAGRYKFYSVIWTLFISHLCNVGVTVGAHRLFTHKTYKAKPLLKAVLLVLHTMAGENCMFVWCRDHRLHHRYSDTDADPHNAKRGFFFSHIGWILTKKHPLVIKLGKQIDMTDLQADWMVMFQKKHYYVLYFVVAFLIPVLVPVYYFGESWTNSVLLTYFLRYMLILNGTWLVNSAAHIYGTRPYDSNLQPVESWFVSVLTSGEGWHNYHHAFPWDYKAAELSTHINFSARYIEFCESIGLAWDLKTVSPEMVEKRILKTGDGTHYRFGNDEARAAVTAVGILHPLNPSYNSVKKAPEAALNPEGLPLYHENDVLDVNNFKRISSTG